MSSLRQDSDYLVKLSDHNVLVSCVGFGDGPFECMDSMDKMTGRRFDNFCFRIYDQLDQENLGAEVF